MANNDSVLVDDALNGGGGKLRLKPIKDAATGLHPMILVAEHVFEANHHPSQPPGGAVGEFLINAISLLKSFLIVNC